MIKIIKLLTFIPWILYFVEIMFYRIHILENKNFDKKDYFEYINKNLFSSINIKEIFLFCIYMIFMLYKNTTVLELLFPAIYVYLLIDFFHTLAKDCKHLKEKFIMVETIIFIVAIILLFIIKNHLYTTYIIMFMVSVLSAFIVYGFSEIRKLFIKEETKN